MMSVTVKNSVWKYICSNFLNLEDKFSALLCVYGFKDCISNILVYVGGIPHQIVTKDTLNTHFNQFIKRTNIHMKISG